MKKTFFIVLILFPFVGCKQLMPPAEKLTNPAKDIIAAFSKKNSNAGIVALLRKDNNPFVYTTGYSNIKKKIKMDKNFLFDIGSASKIFTAIAILQLIEDGKLSLNTTLDSIYSDEGDSTVRKLADLKGENYWGKVTTQMLLNHSSGFYDYMSVVDPEDVVNKVYSFTDLMQLSVSRKNEHFDDANFMPGENFEYSNTNYILLGNIITKISQTKWRKYIQNNIFDKADLENTFFGSEMSEKDKSRMAVGYFRQQIKTTPYTLAGSAGEIVSNIYDMDKFLRYWADGKFYKNLKMFTTQITTGKNSMGAGSTSQQYGLGIIEVGKTVGHSGKTFGFQAYLAIEPKTKNTYVIGINDSDVDVDVLFSSLRGI